MRLSGAGVAAQEVKDALTAECEKLHKSGGLIKVTESGGKVTVKERAEGAGGCPDL